MELSTTIKAVWSFISRANKYIDETAPWALAKDESRKAELATVMYNLAESLRIISGLISPFMPQTAPKVWRQLGLEQVAPFESLQLEAMQKWGGIPADTHIGEAEQLFPRIEIEKEDPQQKAKDAKAAKEAKAAKIKAQQEREAAKRAAAAAEAAGPAAEITIDDFKKIDLRVAEIIAAEPVPKSDKLLQLTVKLGEEERTVVSGIAQQYAPESLIGKHVVLVANLKPAKLRGVMSHGMVLAAVGADGAPVLLETAAPMGTQVR